MKFLIPFKGVYPITQTYDQHVARAKSWGLCWMPNPNCPKGYYYGGIDYGMPVGTPLFAAQAGVVAVSVDGSTGYGTHLKITHKGEDLGEYTSVYGHLSKRWLEAGAVVAAGDQIGVSGNTGNSTGPHLHFEIRKGSVPFDPAPFLVSTVEELDGAIIPGGTEVKTEFITYKGTTNVALNIRGGPSLGYIVSGRLPELTQVDILEESTDTAGNVWGRIGYRQWACLRYQGLAYITYI